MSAALHHDSPGAEATEHSHDEFQAFPGRREMEPPHYEMTKEDDEHYAAFERQEAEEVRISMAAEARLRLPSSSELDDVSRDLDNDKIPTYVPLMIIDSPPSPHECRVEEIEVGCEQKLPPLPLRESHRDHESTDLVGPARSGENSAILLPKPTMEIPNEGFTHIPCFTSDEFSDLEPQRWLVHEVLPAESLVLWWGAPQSGKTAILIDLMFSVAFGEPWLKNVEQGNVLTISLEGHAGFKARVRAAESRRAESLGERAYFVNVPVSVMKIEQINSVARLAKERKVKLIVIDTLAASLAGEADENSNRDMALAMHNAKLLIQMTGATVVITHHTGRDPNANMERGASALRGNVDTSIKTSKSGDHFTWEVVKQRDGPVGVHGKFKIVPYAFPSGNGGELIQSIVVEHVDPGADGARPGAVDRPKPKGHAAAVLEHLKLNFFFSLSATGCVSDAAASIAFQDAVILCKDVLTTINVKHRTTRVREALNWLVRNDHLVESEDQQLTLRP